MQDAMGSICHVFAQLRIMLYVDDIVVILCGHIVFGINNRCNTFFI